MSKLRTILAVFAAVGLASCATAQQPDDTVGAAPALFVARDADSTLYLYGTIHLRRTGDPWGGPHVEAALAESAEVWTEISMTPESEAAAQAEALRLGMAPGAPLSDHLDEADEQRLATLVQSLGLPGEALEPMRPWLAALTLTVMPMLRAGFDPQAGVDRAVTAWAVAHDKTMRAFETPQQQIGFFANLDEETQVAMLRQAVNEAEAGVELVNAMSAAWGRGDGAALETLAISPVRTDYPSVYRSLYVERNNAWMVVLNEELEGAGVDFVAVGAGHIYGPDGLVAQLRARGVRVERVQAQ